MAWYAFDGGVTTTPEQGEIEITEEQYQNAIAAMMDGKSIKVENGVMLIVDTPVVEPEGPTGVELVTASDFWQRMSDDEVDAVDDYLSTQSSRMRRMVNSATEFRVSDTELWNFVVAMVTTLFGEYRAEIILTTTLVYDKNGSGT